jgi:hypothetical protein
MDELVRYSGSKPHAIPYVYGAGCVGCTLEDDGDGETGPHLVVLINPACPVHAELLADDVDGDGTSGA